MASPADAPIDYAAAMVTAPTSAADWIVVAPVLAPILLGAVLLMVRHKPVLHPWIALPGLAIVLASTVALVARVAAEGPLVMTMGGWLPPFGISFAADMLGSVLAMTAAFVALVCAAVAVRDIDTTGRRYGFYPFVMLLMAGVEGSFLTGDIFNLYVWFEVFLISSFGLIVLGSERSQLDGATKYAVLNLVATTLFLIGTGYLYGIFGTLNMADIARKAPGLRETAPLMTLATIYLLAFGMKAAAFPVNFWLPASYHTPRIVVAALFGGLLTKVGIYALLRTQVMFFPVERAVLSDVIAWVAVATMMLGVLGALAQSDIRRVLGFLVISGIGVMLAGLALGTPAGISGAVVYAVHSIIVMTALYLLAGEIAERTGGYSLHDVAGLYRVSPALAAAALLLVLSVAGLPPGSGLWPKVMLVRASLEEGAGMLAFAILASGFLITIAMGRMFALVFWREGENLAVTREARREGLLLLAVLVAPAIAIGLWPQPLIALGDAAAAGLLDPSSYLGAVFPQGAQP
ncbi:MAG: Na+/H+ antiporter subunit D [Rhizobiaceae bacterium]|nr:Na+/H+ antiporter subunit D [Rhizobiaceae bacterium]MCV0405524.1 Na+/H+ antiporter subunit D [Rhizobiaceae bacterium]